MLTILSYLHQFKDLKDLKDLRYPKKIVFTTSPFDGKKFYGFIFLTFNSWAPESERLNEIPLIYMKFLHLDHFPHRYDMYMQSYL